MLSGSTHENKTTRRGSLHLRNGQNAYNHRPHYPDPWSTNLANYLLDDLPASGIAEDKQDCWESKLPFFFSFCERMWCGTWLWPDLVSLVSISKAFFIQKTTGGWVAHCAIVGNKDCVELLKANCSETVSFFRREHARFWSSLLQY